jgi:hypothetical protein
MTGVIEVGWTWSGEEGKVRVKIQASRPIRVNTRC